MITAKDAILNNPSSYSLHECPLCKKNDSLALRDIKDKFQVECCRCGVMSTKNKTRELAVEAWNKRCDKCALLHI